MNGLDLFSGIGGISLALKDWVRPIAYCEIDTYCQGVLLSRMADGLLDKAPIWDDVSTLRAEPFRACTDIIYGGFPCQDISVAGHGKGLAGERSGLFFEIIRLCGQIKPRFIFLENVPAITIRGGAEVVRAITALGYDCRWCIISAASIGALHRRDRWFLLAHSKSERLSGARNEVGVQEKQSLLTYCCEANGPYKQWEIEPAVGRLVNGISNRVDQIKALGNAVVPQQAREAFKILMGI